MAEFDALEGDKNQSGFSAGFETLKTLFVDHWRIIVISATVGMAFGSFLSPVGLRRSNIPFKDGVLMTVSTQKLKDPLHDLSLRNHKVRLLKSQGPDDAPCVIRHPPLMMAASEHVVTLKGSFEDMEKTLVQLDESDLVRPDLVDESDHSIDYCNQQTRIIYGDLK
jgi:hypothetical protein